MNLFILISLRRILRFTERLAREEYPAGNVFLSLIKEQVSDNTQSYYVVVFHLSNEDFIYFLMPTKGSLDFTLTQCRLSSSKQIKEYQVGLANY